MNWVIMGSSNGWSSVQCQAIAWNKEDILSIGPAETHFSLILLRIQMFSVNEMHLKKPSAKS